MPCSCSVGCACASATACAGSTCIGASVAAANIASMGLLLGTYHEMWSPGAANPGRPTPEEQDEIRATLRERNEAALQKLEGKLKALESEVPGGLFRSQRHLDQEKAKLEGRIRRLEHEISILSEE